MIKKRYLLVVPVKTLIYPLAAADTPAQRVQFLLGTEDGDEEHIPHALFTELDEICLREGEDAEWKETARYKSALHTKGWVCFQAILHLMLLGITHNI